MVMGYFYANQDHLHIRGEYTISFTNNFPAIGSPPHTWRILNSVWSSSILQGITSTYVENTLKPFEKFQWIQDHLHIRGEYVKVLAQLLAVAGSPPHTWRILKYRKWLATQIRITSTYVENTILCLLEFEHWQDHLHIRGEYFFCVIVFVQNLGSPPHTWRILFSTRRKC